MHIIWLLLHFFLDILHHVFALSALFCTILYLFIAMNAIIVIIARSKKKSRRNWHSPTTTNDDNHKIPAPHAYSAAKWRGIQIFFFLALYLCNYCYPLTLGTCFKLFREFCRRILSFNGLEYSCRFTTILQSWPISSRCKPWYSSQNRSFVLSSKIIDNLLTKCQLTNCRLSRPH